MKKLLFHYNKAARKDLGARINNKTNHFIRPMQTALSAQHMGAMFIGAASHVAHGLKILSVSSGGQFLIVSQLKNGNILIEAELRVPEANPQLILD